MSTFTPDTGSIPITGRAQWPYAYSEESYGTLPAGGWQVQSVLNVRCSAGSLRLMLVNADSVAKQITGISVKRNFAGTWQMVTVGGLTTITLPAHSMVQSDPLPFGSVVAGDFVYTRERYDLSVTTAFYTNTTSGTYNPEGVSVPGSPSGYNVVEAFFPVTTDRLLEGGTTFEADLSSLTYNNRFMPRPFAVLGVPADPSIRLTKFIGDSKTQDRSPEDGQGNSWAVRGMGLPTGGPYINTSVPGASFATYLASDIYNPLRREMLTTFGNADVLIHLGANDLLGGGGNLTSFVSNHATLHALLPSSDRVFLCTADPLTEKTGGADWTTITPEQQTDKTGTTSIANIQAYNTLVRANDASLHADGFIDLASVAESSPGSAKWKPNQTNDGTHQTGDVNIAQGDYLADHWPVPYDTTAPATPTGLTVKAGDTLAYATWTNPADSDFAATKLRRNGTVIYTGTATQYLDDNLSNGTTYSYTVSAVDSVPNESAQSSAVTVTPGVPGSGSVSSLAAINQSIENGNGLRGFGS